VRRTIDSPFLSARIDTDCIGKVRRDLEAEKSGNAGNSENAGDAEGGGGIARTEIDRCAAKAKAIALRHTSDHRVIARVEIIQDITPARK